MTDFSKPVDTIEVEVPREHAGQRLDSYLPRRFNWRSRNYFFGLVSEGTVRVNGHRVKKSYRLRFGDRISVILPDHYRSEFDYDSIPLSILYEDDFLVAVDKSGTLAVQPTGRYIRENLLYRLKHHYRETNGVQQVEPHIVHRLDRETSGVIIFAKSARVASALAQQFAEKTARKTYLAIVHGHPPESGTIDTPLLTTTDRHVVVDPAGKPALTRYRVKERRGPCTLVELDLMTGRQHQLRVHLASIGHPIVSDELYGLQDDRTRPGWPARHMLHAAELRLRWGEPPADLALSANMPEDMQALLALLH